METRDRRIGRCAGREFRPAVEGLEGRRLLSASNATSSQVAHVRHQFHTYQGELQRIELGSHATVAEYQALRDDARAIGAAASTTALGPQAADAKAAAATLQIDRSPLDGWMGPLAWSDIAAKFRSNLAGLGVPTPLVDRTLADMKATADSAGVSSDEYDTLALDANLLRHGERNLGRNSFVHFPDPGLYFAQHLRGFFRGVAAGRKAGLATLGVDLQSSAAAAGGPPGSSATLHRDVRLLEQVGGRITTSAEAGLGDAFVAMFAMGPPDAGATARFRADARALLGGSASPDTLARIDRLAADAPAFFRALGSSPTRVRQVVDDVQAVVADGVGSSPNPFKVEVARGPQGPLAGPVR